MTEADPSAILLELVQRHGLEARLEHGWVYFEGPRAALRAIVRREDGAAAPQLDLQLALADGRILVESYTGFGPTDEDRIGDAFEHFARASLPVYSAAFLGGGEDDERVEREAWEADGKSFTAFVGPYATRFMDDPMIPVPSGLLPFIRETLLAQRWPGDSDVNEMHWISTLYAQWNGSASGAEVVVDNRRDAKLAGELTRLRWQSDDGYYALRQLTVFCRSGATPRPEVGNPAAYGIRCMLMQCAANPRISDEELVWHLERIGLDSDSAARVVVFAPLGFSNVALAQLGVQDLPTHYQPVDASKNAVGEPLPLEAEPVFAQAREWALAATSIEGGLSGAREVTLRCSLVYSMQQFLAENPGTPVENLRFSNPEVALRPAEDRA